MESDAKRLAVRWADAARVMAVDLADLGRRRLTRPLQASDTDARPRLLRGIVNAVQNAMHLAHGGPITRR